MSNSKRILFLDYLRVIACFMVVIVHVTECFYAQPEGVILSSESNRFWVSVINSICRPAVPLFVMASSYLLVPLPYGSGTFFRRRFVRVVIPFIFWLVMYALLPPFLMENTGWDGVSENMVKILYNFTDTSGHLWFVYMLIGVYCIMPIISPWLKQVSKKGEMIFLGIWFLTTFHHYFKANLGGVVGEATWNEFHLLYYFSGYIGYVVLAHFIRTHIRWSLGKSLAIGIPCIVIGYAVTAGHFYNASLSTTDYYAAELSWRFCTFNIALMTFGMFIILRHVDYAGKIVYRAVNSISGCSYGIYLMHIFVLVFMFGWINPLLSFSTPLTVFATATATYITCWFLTWLITKVPGGRYITG
ncbi:MAG: acyltransferase family protein [Muribaculaceae bacterium]|nr:acyltransferase family protein [Muribaculaceae bacterium]